MGAIKIKLKDIIKNSEIYDFNISSSDRKQIIEVDDWLFKTLPRNSVYSVSYYTDNGQIYADANISIRSREFVARSEGAKLENTAANLISEIKKALYL